MDDLYLDNIDEFVNDHNKIVTYKWLSLTLGVHVNIAKQMLYHYLDHKRKESSATLHATYLVSGKVEENGQTSHKVSVVREEQLEDVKSKMSLTVSVHVYSVQKAALKDSGPLYSADYDAVKDNLNSCTRYSAIRCSSAVPMSSAEVQQAAEQRQAPVPEAEKVKPSVNGHTAALASKPAAKQPKGIMGMFSNKAAAKNQEPNKDVKLEQKEETPEAEASKTKPAVKTNPMSNFFGSQATKKPSKVVKEEAAQPAAPVERSPPRAGPEDIKRPKEAKKDARSKTKRLDGSDSEEDMPGKKKRRRIKRPQSDSSDDDIIPDSPPPPRQEEPVPVPSPIREVKEQPVSQQNGHSDGKQRKRRRVLKSRTFVDEDGCIVTEKAYESESYSETEEDAQASKPPPKAPVLAKPSAGRREDDKKSHKKAAAAANKGTKQASIMGFFQKK